MAGRGASKPIPPVGFVQPCQPILTFRAPEGPEWMHEINHDGYRIIARKDRDGLRVWSRRGRDYTTRFTGISRALSALPGAFMIDGEACAFNGLRYDAQALRTPAGQSAAVLIAFDLIEHNGRDMRLLPVEIRRERLAKLLLTPPDGLLFSQEIEGEGPEVFAHACAVGLAGIVSMRRGTPYVSGYSPAWLKTRNRSFEQS